MVFSVPRIVEEISTQYQFRADTVMYSVTLPIDWKNSFFVSSVRILLADPR
jgi:hypothetical protein